VISDPFASRWHEGKTVEHVVTFDDAAIGSQPGRIHGTAAYGHGSDRPMHQGNDDDNVIALEDYRDAFALLDRPPRAEVRRGGRPPPRRGHVFRSTGVETTTPLRRHDGCFQLGQPITQA